MKNFIKIKSEFYGAALLALVSIASISAQTPPTAQTGPAGQSLQGVELKGKVPVNREVLKIKLPQAQETTLANGLRVILLENHKTPTFAMQMVVLSGGLSDPATQRGLASFTAALLREGTARRISGEISEQFDNLGSTFSANSGLSSLTTNVSTAGLKSNLDKTLDLFADVVRNPQFPAVEVEKYKTRLLPQLQFQRSVPRFLGQERLYAALYGSHAASFVSPPVENLKSVASADLAKFHAAYFRPNNSVLLITGDVSLKELLPKLQAIFGDWQKADVPAQAIQAVTAPDKAHVFLVDRPGSVQTGIFIGTLSVERTSDDYFPLLVMNQVFGAGPAARLFRNLREDKGYTYGAYSSLSASKFPGIIAANAEVRTDVTGDALREFMFEIKRIRAEKGSASEIENAKQAITGSFALSLEQPAALLQYVIQQRIYDLPADYWATYPQRIAAVTVEDVQRVAQKYLDPLKLQIIAVGDGAKIKESLAKYGAVEVFDADGKAVSPKN